jgi:hypothetical protein
MLSTPMRKVRINGQEVIWEGQGASINTRRVLKPPPPRPVARDIRREIWDACYEQGRALTRTEIARALGLKKTPWLIAQIEQLTIEGYLLRSQDWLKNGLHYWTYEVAR